MNVPLTILLKKEEISKMMKRVAKCDVQINAGREPLVGETNADRKQRLLNTVAQRLHEIKELESPSDPRTAA